MLEDGFLIEQRYSAWQKKNVRTVVVNCHSRIPSQRSISAALGFAKPYDRIELVGGEYAETVTLTFPVEIVAAEGEEAKVLSRGSGITITHDIEVFFAEIDIVSKGKGRLEAGVVAMSGSVNMYRCKVNSIIAGGAAFLSLERCTISMSYNGVGLRVNDRAGGALVDCTVNTHFSACIDVDTYGTLLVKKCMLSQPVGLGCVVVVSAAVSARARIMEDVSVEAYSASQPKRLSLRSGMLFDAAGKLVKTPSTMNGIACQLVRFEQNTISVNVSSPPPPEVAFLQDLGGGNGAFAGLGAGNGLSSLTALSEGVASCVVISSGARPTFSRNELSEGDIGFLFEVSGTAKLKENTIRCQRLCGLLAFVDEDGVPASPTDTGDGDASNALTISSENVFDQCKIGIAVQRSGDELGSILQMSALAGITDTGDPDSAGMLATGNLSRVSANKKESDFSWLPTFPPATRCDEELKDAEGLAVLVQGQLVSAMEVEKALTHLVRVAAVAQVASLEAASMANHYSPTSATFPSNSSNSETDILRFLNENLSLNFPSWVLDANAVDDGVTDGTLRPHRKADQGARDVATAQAELLRIRGSQGIDVVNTRFSNCELCALRFGQGGYGLVDRCDFENCGRAAVIVDSGAHPMITGCRFSRTEGLNVVVGNYANPFIFGNTISACQSSGIEVSQLGYGIIAGNSIMKNEGAGVVVRNSSSTIVFGNNIRYNTSGGIVSQYHGKPLIARNVLVGNWLGQIRSEGYANPTLWHNTVASGRDIGILFSTCSSGTATANRITGNASHGIVTERDADPLVTCNDISRNQQCGIVVRDNGVGTFVGNDIIGNMLNNVFVIEGATAVLRRNTIREAGSAGVCVAEEGRGLIEHCSITDNTVANVIVADSHSSTVFIRNIIATSIDGVGILCCREGGGTFRDNVIQNNKLSGVYVTSYGNLSFQRNIVTQEAVGILVTDRGKGVFTENRIVDNYGCGVIVQRQGDPLFTKNTISNAQTNGVLIGPDGRGEFRENEVFSNDVGIQLGSTLGTSEISLQTQYAQSSEELQSEMEKNEVLAQQFHRRRSLLPTTQSTADASKEEEESSDSPKKDTANTSGSHKRAQARKRSSLASLSSLSMLTEYTESAGTGEPVRHSVRLEAVVVANVLSRNTHCGLLVESHAHGTVERNNIHDNGHYGIIGDVLYSMRRAQALAHQERSTVALPVYNTTGGGEALVRENNVHRHLTANIAILDIPDTDTRFELNEIHTAPVGIFVGNQSNANLLLNNKIHHCADGVFVDNGGKGNFVGNTIEDCSSCGVYCSTGGQPRFTADNLIRRCNVAGILVDAYGAGAYSNCRISACTIGVVVHAGPCAVPSSNWHENILVGSAVYASAEFTGNTIEKNELHGVLALSSPLGHSIRECVCLRRRESFSSSPTAPGSASPHGPKAGARDSNPITSQKTRSRTSSIMDAEMTLAHWSSTIPQDPSGRYYPLFKGNHIRQNRFFGVFHDVLPAPLSSLPAGQSGSLAQLTTQVEARDELHFIAQRNRASSDPNAHQPVQRSASIASHAASATHVSASSVAAAAAAAPRGTRVSSKSLPSGSVPFNSSSSTNTNTTRLSGTAQPAGSAGEGELEKNPAANPHAFSPSQTLVKYMCFIDNDIEECTIGACVGSTCRPYFQDNRIVKNVFFGLFLRTRSQVLCRHCLIEDNGIAGVYTSFGALGIVANSAVLRNNGFRRDPGNPYELRDFTNTPASKSFFCPSSAPPPEFLETDCEQLLVRSSVKLQHIEAMHTALLDDSVRLLGELVAVPSCASSVAQYTFPQHQPTISEVGNLESSAWRNKVASIESDGNVTAAGGGIGVWLTEGCETVVRDSIVESNSQVGILFSRGADKVYAITRKSVPDIPAVQRALGGESNPEPEEAEWLGATRGIRYTLPKGGKPALSKPEPSKTHPPSTYSFVSSLEAKGYLFMTKSLFSSVPKEIVASFYSRNTDGAAGPSSRSGSFVMGSGVGVGVSLVNMDSLLEGNFSIASTSASGSFENGKDDGYSSNKTGALGTNRQKDSQLHNPHAIATVYRNRIVSNGTGICVQLFNNVGTVDKGSSPPSTDDAPKEKETRSSGKPVLSAFDVGTPHSGSPSRTSLKRDAVILPSRWQSTWYTENVSSGDEIAQTLAETPEKLPLLALHAMSESHFSVLPHVVNVSFNEIIGNLRHGIQCVHLLEIDAAAHVHSRVQLNEALETQESLRMQWNPSAVKERPGHGAAGTESTVPVLLSLAARPKKTRHAIIENNELRRNTQDQILISAHVVVVAEDETKISLLMDTTMTPDLSTLSSKLLVQVPIVASLVQSASPGIFLVQRNLFSEGAIGVRLLGPLDGNSVRLRYNRFNGLTSAAVSVDGHLACGTVGEGNHFVDNRLAGQVLVPQTARQETLGSGYESTSCNSLPTRVFGNTFEGPGQVSLLSHGCEAVAPLFIYHNDFTSHPEGTVAVLVCGERTTLRLTHNSFTDSHIPLIVCQRAGKSGNVAIESNHFKRNIIGALLGGGSTPQLALNFFNKNALCGIQIVGADTQPRVHMCVFVNQSSSSSSEDDMGSPSKQPRRIPADCNVTIAKAVSASTVVRSSPLTRSSPLKRFADSSTFLLADSEYTLSSFAGRSAAIDNVEVKLVYPKFDGDQQMKTSSTNIPAESNPGTMSLVGAVPSGLVVGRGAGGVCENCLFQDNDVGVDIYRDAVASSDRPTAALFTLKDCLLSRHQYTGVLLRGSGQVQRNKLAPLLQHTTLEISATVSGCCFVENTCIDQKTGDIIVEDNGFAVVENSVMTGVTQAKRGGYAVFRRNTFISDEASLTADTQPAFVLHGGNRSCFTENTILNKRLGALALQGTWAKVEHNLFLKSRVGVESAPLCNAAFSHNRIVASSDCGLIAYGGIFSSNEVSGCPVGVVLHNPSAWKKFAALVASRPTEGTAQLLFFDNVVHACDTDGILVAGGGKISGNRIFNCKTNIHLVARAPTHEMDSLPLLSRNVCYDGETGIILDSDTVGTVSEQEVFDNSVLGVLVNSGSTCVVERNQISSALDHGAMEVAADSAIKNTQNLIRNQFSPAYNKGLQSVRVKDRQRAAVELAAEMNSAEDAAAMKAADKSNMTHSMAHLCGTLRDEVRVGRDAWQLSQTSPDRTLVSSPSRVARGGRFSNQGMSTTDDPFGASGTSASIARKRSARRHSSVGFADDSPRSRRKSAAVSFTAKGDMGGTLKRESSMSRQSSPRFANMGSFSRRKSNVSVGGEVPSPPRRQPSASVLKKPRSSIARGSVTSASGDAPTNYGRQKQRRASRAARDAKAVVERQQRNSNSLSDVLCVHDVLIHVVLLRDSAQRPSLGSETKMTNGDAISGSLSNAAKRNSKDPLEGQSGAAAAAAASSPTDTNNPAADADFGNGIKDAQMERTIAMERMGQSVASAFSSIYRHGSDTQKVKDELKFSCVITTNALDLSTYLATTTPSISVTVLCTSLDDDDEGGASNTKITNISKLEFHDKDKNSLVQLHQCFAVTRSRKSSSVGARTQSLRLSFVVCPSALLGRVHVSEKHGKRANPKKSKKRASTTALPVSAGGITLEDYSATCTAVTGFSKEVSDCRDAFIATVKEELDSSSSGGTAATSRAPSTS